MVHQDWNANEMMSWNIPNDTIDDPVADTNCVVPWDNGMS